MNTTLFPMDESKPKYAARPYQIDCDRAVDKCLQEHASCLALLATGTGKTEIAASLIRSQKAMDGAVVITHLRDLVTQTAARLRSRGIECGIEMATLRSESPVTVGCYASMLSRRRYENFIGKTKLLIIDESHLNYTASAMQMIGFFREAGCKVVGMTATPDRGSGDPITKFYGPVAFYYPYRAAHDDGWLVPTRIWTTVIEGMDLKKCQGTSKEFNIERLGEVMTKEAVVWPIASMIEQHYEGEKSVVFCASIAQAEMLRENLYRRNINASIVHSEMDPTERQMHLHDFERGDSDIVINVGCLTLGWDHPPVRKLFIARPTKSKALYQQMFGRGTRPLPGVVDGWSTPEQRKQAIADSAKPYCEIFDITDTSRHNDLQCAIDIFAPELDRKLMQRVRNRMASQKDAPVEPDAVIAAETAAMAAEEAARYALEIEKRKHLVGHARFGVYERDTFAAAEDGEDRTPKPRRWHMLFGKHKGWPIRDVPTEYLRWFATNINCKNTAFMNAVRAEAHRRATGRETRT